MKRQTSVAMFGITFAAVMALGIVSVSGFSQPLFVASTDMKAENHMGMMGHITFTATDQDGNILSYIQTDNIIVNVGENCVAESIFNVTTTGTDLCDGTGTQSASTGTPQGVADGGFTFIAIGNGSGVATETDQKLVKENFRIRANSTSVASSGIAGSSEAVVTLTGIFVANTTSTLSIDESGIFDKDEIFFGGSGPVDENMLARQTFTAIDLTLGDKLTVEWEVTIGS